MRSAKYWKKRSIIRTAKSEKELEARQKAINRVYQSASKQIQDDINQIYKTYGKKQGIDVDSLLEKLSTADTAKFWSKMVKSGDLEYIKANYKARITRLEQLQGELYSKVHGIRNDEIAQHNIAHTNTINNSYHRTVYDTQKGTGADIAFGGLNSNVMNQVLNAQWQGSNYSERIWSNTDRLAVVTRDLLGSALLTGKSRRRVASEMAENFNVAQYVADRLVRTETNYFQNEAEAIANEDMGIDEYVYIAVLDRRTSYICSVTDRLKFKYKDRKQGVNYPPLHPNCRSTTRGFIGDDFEPKTRTARNANGQPISIPQMNYAQWRETYKIDDVKPTKPPVPKAPKIQIKSINEDGAVKVTRKAKTALPIEPTIRGDVDPALVAVLRDGMGDVYKRYPQAFQRLNLVRISKTEGSASNLNGVHEHGIETRKTRFERDSDSRIRTYKDGSNLVTGDLTLTKRISVRVPNGSNTFEEYGRRVKSLFDRGWWSTATPKAVMHHELGHALEQTMNMKHHNLIGQWNKFQALSGKRVVMNKYKPEIRELNSQLAKHTMATELVQKTIKEIDPTANRYTFVRKNISDYSKKSDAESFAELFAKVMNNDKDPITKVFKRNLDSKLKELDLS